MSEKNPNELAELTALSALDALSRAERTAAEWRITSAGEEVRGELEELRAVAAEIGLSVEPAEPPTDLRNRLLDAVDEDGREAPSPSLLMHEAGVLISSTDQMPWTPLEVPGVAVKTLFIDEQTGEVTSLVRMDPDVEYPKHRHAEAEEIFILSGDLLVHGQSMGPGDYCRADADSVHLPSRTVNGVVFIAKTSTADEILH